MARCSLHWTRISIGSAGRAITLLCGFEPQGPSAHSRHCGRAWYSPLDVALRSLHSRSVVDRVDGQGSSSRKIDATDIPLSTPADVSQVILEDLAVFRRSSGPSLRQSYRPLVGLRAGGQSAPRPRIRGPVPSRAASAATLHPCFTIESRHGTGAAARHPVSRGSCPTPEGIGVPAAPLGPQYWRRDFSRCSWDGGHTFKFRTPFTTTPSG